MDEPKFRIGQEVYTVHAHDNGSIVETCPTCAGSRFVTVTGADGVGVRTDCGACSRGYDSSSGTITRYGAKAVITPGRITAIELRQRPNAPEEWAYGINGSSFHQDGLKVFLTYAEAATEGELEVKLREEENRARAFHKVKDHKSWAWHVAYYQKQIRDALRQIEYAEARLHIAKGKSLTEKKSIREEAARHV